MTHMDWNEAEDATLKALPKTIVDAEAGDRNAKARLLEIFCAMVDSGSTPYPALLAYVSRHFKEALDSKGGKDVLARALLGGPGHRLRPPERDERDQGLALAVQELTKVGHAELAAIQEVAEHYGYTEKVVDHAWRRYKNSSLLNPPFPDPN